MFAMAAAMRVCRSCSSHAYLLHGVPPSASASALPGQWLKSVLASAGVVPAVKGAVAGRAAEVRLAGL